jgi:hypothetical protein
MNVYLYTYLSCLTDISVYGCNIVTTVSLCVSGVFIHVCLTTLPVASNVGVGSALEGMQEGAIVL